MDERERLEQDRLEQERMEAERIEQDKLEAERLKKWAGEQEALRIANQKEADELAILIKEELAKPKLDERVEQVESKTATLAETLEVLFG